MSKQNQGPRKRWSFKAKAEVVQRLLSGEPIDEVSRQLAVPVHELERWRQRALAAMEEGLKERAPDDHRRDGIRAAQPRRRQPVFRLVSYRYRRGALLITSNRHVREWPEVLAGDETLAGAILDRLLHASHVIPIAGRSYRLRDLDDRLGNGS